MDKSYVLYSNKTSMNKKYYWENFKKLVFNLHYEI